ncbi:MAG: hypoxanthine phosphoribosyltransferase, partial [Pseudomonadota bacterium]
IEADFIGFECPADLFVVGYGLDKAFKYRQLPFIGYISTDH